MEPNNLRVTSLKVGCKVAAVGYPLRFLSGVLSELISYSVHDNNTDFVKL